MSLRVSRNMCWFLHNCLSLGRNCLVLVSSIGNKHLYFFLTEVLLNLTLWELLVLSPWYLHHMKHKIQQEFKLLILTHAHSFKKSSSRYHILCSINNMININKREMIAFLMQEWISALMLCIPKVSWKFWDYLIIFAFHFHNQG